MVGTVLEGLHDRHASLVGLDDLELHITDVVLVGFSGHVALDADGLPVVIWQGVTIFTEFGILVYVVLLTKLEESLSWILNLTPVVLQELLQRLNRLTACCICRSLCVSVASTVALLVSLLVALSVFPLGF